MFYSWNSKRTICIQRILCKRKEEKRKQRTIEPWSKKKKKKINRTSEYEQSTRSISHGKKVNVRLEKLIRIKKRLKRGGRKKISKRRKRLCPRFSRRPVTHRRIIR